MPVKKIDVSASSAYDKSFNELPDNSVKEKIKEAIEFLREDTNLGDKIQKNLWPKRYRQKYHIDNLWRYNVNSHRLIYTIITEYYVKTYALLDVLSHPEYEKLFHY